MYGQIGHTQNGKILKNIAYGKILKNMVRKTQKKATFEIKKSDWDMGAYPYVGLCLWGNALISLNLNNETIYKF